MFGTHSYTHKHGLGQTSSNHYKGVLESIPLDRVQTGHAHRYEDVFMPLSWPGNCLDRRRNAPWNCANNNIVHGKIALVVLCFIDFTGSVEIGRDKGECSRRVIRNTKGLRNELLSIRNAEKRCRTRNRRTAERVERGRPFLTPSNFEKFH